MIGSSNYHPLFFLIADVSWAAICNRWQTFISIMSGGHVLFIITKNSWKGSELWLWRTSIEGCWPQGLKAAAYNSTAHQPNKVATIDWSTENNHCNLKHHLSILGLRLHYHSVGLWYCFEICVNFMFYYRHDEVAYFIYFKPKIWCITVITSPDYTLKSTILSNSLSELHIQNQYWSRVLSYPLVQLIVFVHKILSYLIAHWGCFHTSARRGWGLVTWGAM